MNKTATLLGLGSLLLGVLLVGCMARPEITPLPPSPMMPVIPTQAAEVVSTEAPTEAASADDSACVSCHTDQERLTALAVEPESAESLSEGEG